MNTEEAKEIYNKFEDCTDDIIFEKNFSIDEFITDSKSLPYPKEEIEEAIFSIFKTLDEYDSDEVEILIEDLEHLPFFQDDIGSIPKKIPESFWVWKKIFEENEWEILPSLQKIIKKNKLTSTDKEKINNTFDAYQSIYNFKKITTEMILLKVITHQKNIRDRICSYIDEKIEICLDHKKNLPEEFELNDNEINLMEEKIWSFEDKYDRLSGYGAWLGFIIAWTIAYIYSDSFFILSGFFLMIFLSGGIVIISEKYKNYFVDNNKNKINKIEKLNNYKEGLKEIEQMIDTWKLLKLPG